MDPFSHEYAAGIDLQRHASMKQKDIFIVILQELQLPETPQIFATALVPENVAKN